MTTQSTEEKIKEAARKLFHEKGFEGTKTRDIAEAAGINLALLNYYFRSKKKLFDLIMMETIQAFFSGLIPILNDRETTLREKIIRFVDAYITMLMNNPDIPPFIMNEARQDPKNFVKKMGVLNHVKGSYLAEQFAEAMQKGELPPVNPLHLILNLSGMVVFPFLARPILQSVTGVPNDIFDQMILERKELIPRWLEATLRVT